MGPLREIVEADAVGRLFAILAVVGPILGLIIGVLIGLRRQAIRKGAVTGLFIGLLGTLNWLLWTVYNALTDANGLDTVRNLFLNLVLFVLVGAAIGFGIGRVRLRNAGDTTPAENAPDPPQ